MADAEKLKTGLLLKSLLRDSGAEGVAGGTFPLQQAEAVWG